MNHPRQNNRVWFVEVINQLFHCEKAVHVVNSSGRVILMKAFIQSIISRNSGVGTWKMRQQDV